MRGRGIVFRWALGVVVASLVSACPTREFYRVPAEPPWDLLGPEGVAVPAFEASPDAWSLAEEARAEVVRVLERGAVEVTPRGHATHSLVGRILEARLATVAGAPRRVLRAGTNVTGAGSNLEAWVWEQDVDHGVTVKVALRLERADREALWLRSGEGRATSSRVESLAWPGSDPLPPPRTHVTPPEPALASSLRRQALAQALAPLLAALTDRYEYRTVP